jgi:hypothetical protein
MVARPAPLEARRDGSATASGLLGEIDRALAKAAREVRLLAAVTPENLAEQRARIAGDLGRGDARAPRFTYARADRTEVLRSLDAILRSAATAFHPRLAEVYVARIEELVLEARIAEAAGSPRLGELARARFAGGDAEAAVRASELAAEWLKLAQGPASPGTLSDADEPGSLLSMMRREVGARRLPYAVETSGALLCRAATGERTIWVSRGKLLTEEETRRTVVHEIEGHAMPRVRAASRSPIFAIGTARGTDDQEGFALLAEERAGAMGPRRRRELAARHRAVEEMCNGAGFADVARDLVREHGLSLESALDVTERAFRGSDGRGPGLGRERVYIGAWLRVSAHLLRRPDDESVLASGQVALSWIGALSSP